MKSEIYKDHYEFEWGHRAHLMSATGIPVAGATLVGGALVTMLESVPSFAGPLGYTFSIFAGTTALFLTIAVAYLFRTHYGYTYKRIPTPLKLHAHYESLQQWYGRRDSAPAVVDEEFQHELDQRIGEAVEVNAANNLRKSVYLHRANRFVALSLVSIALASGAYLIQKRAQEPQPYKVQLVTP